MAKLRVADAADRVRRLREIMAKLEEDPMLLVPEEVDTDAEEEDDDDEEGKEKKPKNGDKDGEKGESTLNGGETTDAEQKDAEKTETDGGEDSKDDKTEAKEETVSKKPKRVYENQPLLIPFDLVHGNSVRVFCAICRKEYINRYLLKVRVDVRSDCAEL